MINPSAVIACAPVGGDNVVRATATAVAKMATLATSLSPEQSGRIERLIWDEAVAIGHLDLRPRRPVEPAARGNDSAEAEYVSRNRISVVDAQRSGAG
jgi:hypothetical protein